MPYVFAVFSQKGGESEMGRDHRMREEQNTD